MKKTLLVVVTLSLIQGVGLNASSSDIYREAVSVHERSKKHDIHFNEGVQAYNNGDYDVAREKFKMSKMLGNALGSCALMSAQAKLDEDPVAQDIQACADEGIKPGQYVLGYSHYHGLHGVKQDLGKAFEYFQAAALESRDTGSSYAKAVYAMGVMYFNGYSVGRDYKAAFECFKKAAEIGYVKAMYLYAYCLKYGYGVEQNSDVASIWYNKWCEQDDSSMKQHLLLRYFYQHDLVRGVITGVPVWCLSVLTELLTRKENELRRRDATNTPFTVKKAASAYLLGLVIVWVTDYVMPGEPAFL